MYKMKQCNASREELLGGRALNMEKIKENGVELNYGEFQQMINIYQERVK